MMQGLQTHQPPPVGEVRPQVLGKIWKSRRSNNLTTLHNTSANSEELATITAGKVPACAARLQKYAGATRLPSCDRRSRTFTGRLVPDYSQRLTSGEDESLPVADFYPGLPTPETGGHGCQFHQITIYIAPYLCMPRLSTKVLKYQRAQHACRIMQAQRACPAVTEGVEPSRGSWGRFPALSSIERYGPVPVTNLYPELPTPETGGHGCQFHQITMLVGKV